MTSPDPQQTTTTPTSQFVSNAERQYLILVARRVLHFRRDATSRGEAYHDLTAPTRLACGARVRLFFLDSEKGPVASVAVRWPAMDLSLDEVKQIAAEIVGGEVEGPTHAPDEVLFERRPK